MILLPILLAWTSGVEQWLLITGATISSQCRGYNLIEHPCNAVVTSHKILVGCRNLWLERIGRLSLIMNSKLCLYINRKSFTTNSPVVSELTTIPLSTPDPTKIPNGCKGIPPAQRACSEWRFEALSDVVSVLRRKDTVEIDHDAPQCVYSSSIIVYDKANISVPWRIVILFGFCE